VTAAFINGVGNNLGGRFMKNNFMLIFLLILLNIIATCVSANSDDNHIRSDSIKGFTVKGMDQISDPEFKKMLSQYLFLDEKFSYKQLYDFYSKEYLKKYFPNIKNADEYALRMENSEVSELKYTGITQVRYQENQYEVDIVFNAMSEGERQLIKTTYFFIKENNEWKYNGLDIKNYKELK
jgi:hypothetical protein